MCFPVFLLFFSTFVRIREQAFCSLSIKISSLSHKEKLSCKDIQLRRLTSTKTELPMSLPTESWGQVLCAPLVAISLLAPFHLKLPSLYHSNTGECKARIIQRCFVTKNNWRIPELTFMFEWFLCTTSWSKFPIRNINNAIPAIRQLVDEKNSLFFSENVWLCQLLFSHSRRNKFHNVIVMRAGQLVIFSLSKLPQEETFFTCSLLAFRAAQLHPLEHQNSYFSLIFISKCLLLSVKKKVTQKKTA